MVLEPCGACGVHLPPRTCVCPTCGEAKVCSPQRTGPVATAAALLLGLSLNPGPVGCVGNVDYGTTPTDSAETADTADSSTDSTDARDSSDSSDD